MKKFEKDSTYYGIRENDLLIAKQSFKLEDKQIEKGEIFTMSTDVYGAFRLRSKNNQLSFSSNRNEIFTFFTTHFTIDERLKQGEIYATVKFTGKNGKVHTPKVDDYTSFRIQTKYYHDHYSTEIEFKQWLEHTSKNSWGGNVKNFRAKKVYDTMSIKTNGVSQNVRLDVDDSVENVSFVGDDKLKELRLSFGGFNPVPLSLILFEDMEYTSIINAEFEVLNLTSGIGKQSLTRCLIKKLFINHIDTEKWHPEFTNCYFGSISVSGNIKMVEKEVKIGHETAKMTWFYDASTEGGLLLLDGRIQFLHKKTLVNDLMAFQMHDVAAEFGLDIIVDKNLLSKIEIGWGSPIVGKKGGGRKDTTFYFDITRKWVKILDSYGRFYENVSLYSDGIDFKTIVGEQHLSVEVAEGKISKETYAYIIDIYIKIFGEDFVYDHMYLHSGQTGGLFDRLRLEDTCFTFAKKSIFHLNVEHLSMDLLPESVSGLVKKEGGLIYAVEGEAVYDDGEAKLFPDAKLVRLNKYAGFEDVHVDWYDRDVVTIRRKKTINKK